MRKLTRELISKFKGYLIEEENQNRRLKNIFEISKHSMRG